MTLVEKLDAIPEYVESIGFGVNEFQCTRCDMVWAGWDVDGPANHDCVEPTQKENEE